MTHTREHCPLTRANWAHIVKQLESTAAIGVEQDWRRGSPRVNVETGLVKLTFVDDDGKSIQRTTRLLEASKDGLTVKSHASVRDQTPVTIQIDVTEGRFVTAARVMHSSTTVGGYKLGLRLLFSDVNN